MKILKWTGIVLALLIAVAIALPFFISLNDYIPTIEREASAKLKEPVTIGSLRASLLPVPQLTVDGITIGKTGDIKVGKIAVTPDLFSLLTPVKVIRSVEVDTLIVTQKGIDKVRTLTKTEDARKEERPQVLVQSVKLSNALVKLEKTSFGPFDARVRLGSGGEIEDASIATQDGKLKAQVKPEKSQYLIDASAKSWKLPAGPAIVFDELAIKGVATLKDARLDQVNARLYGGTVRGRANLGWQKGFQLRGNLDVNQVELKSLVPLLAPGNTRVSGRLNAKPVFSANAASPAKVMDAMRLETPFNVQNGVLYGFDIAGAATSLIKQGSSGGETRFDELSGHLTMERGGYRFTQLKVASGALAANGNVNISPKKDLSGRINAQVQAVGTSASVPLNVAGTLQSPLLIPTGATVAGAAVGTAIMGPGFGTSVGAKVGGWAESLFGRKEEKK